MQQLSDGASSDDGKFCPTPTMGYRVATVQDSSQDGGGRGRSFEVWELGATRCVHPSWRDNPYLRGEKANLVGLIFVVDSQDLARLPPVVEDDVVRGGVHQDADLGADDAVETGRSKALCSHEDSQQQPQNLDDEIRPQNSPKQERDLQQPQHLPSPPQQQQPRDRRSQNFDVGVRGMLAGILREPQLKGLPLLFLANKQDCPPPGECEASGNGCSV